MKKAVEIISVGEAAHKGEFLRHIAEMVHHEILPKETFKEHFARLLKNYENKPEYHEAFKEFIEYQPEEISTIVPWNHYEFGNPEEVERQFHIFNVFNPRPESTQ